MQVHKARLFGTDIVAVKELNDPTPAHEERFRQEVGPCTMTMLNNT